MVGFQERVEAAGSAFSHSIKDYGTALRVQAKAAGTFFREDGQFITYTTGAILTIGIPLIALPLSTAEAIRGFIKPAEVKQM